MLFGYYFKIKQREIMKIKIKKTNIFYFKSMGTTLKNVLVTYLFYIFTKACCLTL